MNLYIKIIIGVIGVFFLWNIFLTPNTVETENTNPTNWDLATPWNTGGQKFTDVLFNERHIDTANTCTTQSKTVNVGCSGLGRNGYTLKKIHSDCAETYIYVSCGDGDYCVEPQGVGKCIGIEEENPELNTGTVCEEKQSTSCKSSTEVKTFVTYKNCQTGFYTTVCNEGSCKFNAVTGKASCVSDSIGNLPIYSDIVGDGLTTNCMPKLEKLCYDSDTVKEVEMYNNCVSQMRKYDCSLFQHCENGDCVW